MTRPTTNPPALRELLDDATLADLRDLGDEAERLTPEIRKFAEKVWATMDRYYTASTGADHDDTVQDFLRVHSGAERLIEEVGRIGGGLLDAIGARDVNFFSGGWFQSEAGRAARVAYYESVHAESVHVARAKAWLEDCINDVPDDLSPAGVRAAIDRSYEGGWDQFVKDGQPD